MGLPGLFRTAVRWLAATAGFAALAYGAIVGTTWLRYGRSARPAVGDAADPLLDQLIPSYDIAERHQIRVSAPADLTFKAATEVDLRDSLIVRAIFRAREVALGSEPGAIGPRGILAMTTSIGWGILAERPGREVVVGAVTQPWEANVVFHPLPPGTFAAFAEPGWVKIVWTLRADPDGSAGSIARTETRVATTDLVAREKFRRYWSFVAPGIVLIRPLMLRLVKRSAERLAQAAARQ
jgi:hypothetical protein